MNQTQSWKTGRVISKRNPLSPLVGAGTARCGAQQSQVLRPSPPFLPSSYILQKVKISAFKSDIVQMGSEIMGAVPLWGTGVTWWQGQQAGRLSMAFHARMVELFSEKTTLLALRHSAPL